MTVNLPVDEFRKELYKLIDQSFFKNSVDVALELLSGPLIPFVGEIYGSGFRLRRNVNWLWRSWYYVDGNFFEKDGVTIVNYQLKIDRLRLAVALTANVFFFFLLISVFIAGSPFLAIFLIGIFVATTLGLNYWRTKKLVNSFLTEMNMLPHNSKSRFKK